MKTPPSSSDLLRIILQVFVWLSRFMRKEEVTLPSSSSLCLSAPSPPPSSVFLDQLVTEQIHAAQLSGAAAQINTELAASRSAGQRSTCTPHPALCIFTHQTQADPGLQWSGSVQGGGNSGEPQGQGSGPDWFRIHRASQQY